MGWATRWLKGWLSGRGRKKAEREGDQNARAGKEKKGWGFARSFRDKERGGGGEGGGRCGVEERRGVAMARSSHGSSVTGDGEAVVVKRGDEQNKRAIAVAAATAAAAEAAVAAAQAAAAVVRLTSRGGGAVSGRRSEDWAAVRIQAVFRGYLARRALKALKGLVKLQALVRGHIVRKQAVETLRCMQALVRVQSRAREGRGLRDNQPPNKGSRYHHPIPPTPENHESKIHINGAKAVRSASVGRNGTKAKKSDTIDTNLLQSSGWNWLDRWMEERYWDGREALSKTGTATDDERSVKVLEVDAGKPRLNVKWSNNHHSMCSSLSSDQNSRSYMTMLDSPSKDSTIAQHSVPSPSSVCLQQSLSPLRFPDEAEDLCVSPQLYTASSMAGSSMRGPFTPSKSECSRSYFNGFSDYPNYMSNTESSKAKLRSHSAPRQRPEYEKSGSVKRPPAIGYRADDLSSTASQRSSLHLKFTGKAYPGSGRLDRMGMPIRTL